MTLEERLENLDNKLEVAKDLFEIELECVKDNIDLKDWYNHCIDTLDEKKRYLFHAFYALEILSDDEYDRMKFMIDTYEEYITSKYKRKKKEMSEEK